MILEYPDGPNVITGSFKGRRERQWQSDAMGERLDQPPLTSKMEENHKPRNPGSL